MDYMSNTVVILFLSAVILILCFLPNFYERSFIEESSILLKTLQNSTVAFSITLTGALPLFVDLIFDLLVVLFIPKKTTQHASISFFLLERGSIILSMALPSIFYFCSSDQGWLQRADTTVSLLVAQRIFIGGPVLSFLGYTCPESFPATFRSVIFTGNTLLHLLSMFWDKHGIVGQVSFIVGTAAAVVSFGLMSGSILHVLATQVRRVLNKPKSVTPELFLTVGYSISVVLYSVILIVMMWSTQHFDDLDCKTLLWYNIALTVMCVIPASLPGRLARSQVGQTEKLLDLKQHFVRYISHEMRTPMNVASVGIELLDESLTAAGLKDEEAIERIADVKSAIEISIDILNDILTYEKISSNLMTLECAPHFPLQFIHDSFRLFHQQASQKQIVLNLPGPDSYEALILRDRTVNIDEKKMGQVIRNIVSNALKFTSEGGSISVTMSITTTNRIKRAARSNNSSDESRSFVSSFVAAVAPDVESRLENSLSILGATQSGTLRTRREYLQIDIIDNGAGIAFENIPKVFNEIIQFDANKLQGGKGSGLGLFISKGIVDLHNGSIAVHSDGIGFGCRFSVLLPLDHAAASNKSQPLWRRMVGASMKVSAVFPGDEEGDVGGGGGGEGEAGGGEAGGEGDHLKSEDDDEQGTALVKSSTIGTLQDFGSCSTRIMSDKLDVKCLAPAGSASDLAFFVACDAAASTSAGISSGRGGVAGGGGGAGAVEVSSSTGRSQATLEVPAKLDLRGRRVLLVDDSAMNIKMMSIILKKVGAECLFASDGLQAVGFIKASQELLKRYSMHGDSIRSFEHSREYAVDSPYENATPTRATIAAIAAANAAIAAAQNALAEDGRLHDLRQCIDFVIMDNFMPVMNGPEACKLMREIGYEKPIFGLTGDCAEEDVLHYLNAGANHVFLKPLNMADFRAVLLKQVV